MKTIVLQTISIISQNEKAMDSSDYLITEQHDGVCGHCRSPVPNEATTCSGCGAYWGFSNGKNRDELLRDANTDIKIGLGYIALMVAFVLLSLMGLKFMIVLFLFGVLFSLKFLGEHLLSGLVNRRHALKPSADEIDWWLKK